MVELGWTHCLGYVAREEGSSIQAALWTAYENPQHRATNWITFLSIANAKNILDNSEVAFLRWKVDALQRRLSRSPRMQMVDHQRKRPKVWAGNGKAPLKTELVTFSQDGDRSKANVKGKKKGNTKGTRNGNRGPRSYRHLSRFRGKKKGIASTFTLKTKSLQAFVIRSRAIRHGAVVNIAVPGRRCVRRLWVSVVASLRSFSSSLG